MFKKLICFFLGHKIDRLKAFKDKPLIRAIDPNENEVLLIDVCLRCGVVHGRKEKYKNQ